MKRDSNLLEGLIIIIAISGIILSLVFLLMGGVSSDFFINSNSPLESDKEIQDRILEKGKTAEAVYEPENFLSRSAINEWTLRMDTPEKLWYVYLMTDSGAFVGYHICRTVPLSYGIGLTAPMQIINDPNGSYDSGSRVVPAPGVDGVYYAGADSEVHYCFDAETDALVTFKTNFVFYDMPLDLSVPELKIVN